MSDTTHTSESRNVRIARLLGWRAVEVADGVSWFWRLISPAGKAVYLIRGVTEEAAWRSGLAQCNSDFVDSCDASLAAIDPRRDVQFESDYDGKVQVCWIEPLTINEDSYRGEGATRAAALAVALEAMLVAKQEAE